MTRRELLWLLGGACAGAWGVAGASILWILYTDHVLLWKMSAYLTMLSARIQ